MVIGEVPSAEDDCSGRPFDGASGELLAKMITAMGFDRSAIFVTHAVKCRTMNGRSPHAPELAACRDYLHRQAALAAPRAIVCFGPWALAGLIPETASRKFGELRGQWQQHGAIPVMPTFAPSYVEGDAAKKRIVWGDLQLVMAALKG